MEEHSNPLATESFSYSWLVDKKPHSFDKYIEKAQSFDFDIPFTSSSHLSLVHADEIFSDGRIMPVYVDRSSVKAANSVPQSPVSAHSGRKKRPFMKRVWQKCFKLVKLKQLCVTIGCSRKSSRVADLERKVCEARKFGSSVEASPRLSSVGDSKGTRRQDDGNYGLERVKSWNCSSQASNRVRCVDESSIHEAILYCKRSIEI